MEEDPGSILAGLWGGNFSVRREHWLAADGLDRIALEHMHTDREFGLRLRRLGLRGRFDRRLRAVHEDVHDLTRLTHSARGTAIAHARLRAAYADLDDDHSKPWLCGALRPVVCRPRLWAAVLGGLMAFTRFAGARRLRALEYALSRGVWRLEYERTLHEAREHPPSAARDPAGSTAAAYAPKPAATAAMAATAGGAAASAVAVPKANSAAGTAPITHGRTAAHWRRAWMPILRCAIVPTMPVMTTTLPTMTQATPLAPPAAAATTKSGMLTASSAAYALPIDDEKPIAFTNQPIVAWVILRLPQSPRTCSRPVIAFHLGPRIASTSGSAAPRRSRPAGTIECAVDR